VKTPDSSYADYVGNSSLHEKYSAYQERYSTTIRESDRVLIDLVRNSVAAATRQPRVLDIGCSTGNLLAHIREALPELDLTGADLAQSVIDVCRDDPRLAGIEFSLMDMLGLTGRYEVIIANAVAVYFSHEEYDRAIASVAAALEVGGTYLAFEWLHPFPQDIEIRETSSSHPNGLKIHFRPYSIVEEILARHGFGNVEFRPFSIPIDLERGATFAGNPDGFEELNSYTVRTETGDRMLFRGTLYQPWCHLVAQKTR
jgi:SAM-dependent methyltransferase